MENDYGKRSRSQIAAAGVPEARVQLARWQDKRLLLVWANLLRLCRPVFGDVVLGAFHVTRTEGAMAWMQDGWARQDLPLVQKRSGVRGARHRYSSEIIRFHVSCGVDVDINNKPQRLRVPMCPVLYQMFANSFVRSTRRVRPAPPALRLRGARPASTLPENPHIVCCVESLHINY